MATFKTAPKIAARPQIKAVQQPIPRQVILPKKAQPVAKPIAKPVPKPVPKPVSRPVYDPRVASTATAPNNRPAPTMGQSSVGTMGYPSPANGVGDYTYQGQQPFNPAVNTMGGFGGNPQGNRQIPQEMIDANARASALNALQAPTNYGGAENMIEMMKSQQGRVPDYAMSGDYSGGQGSGIPFGQVTSQLGGMPQQNGNPMFNPAYNAPDVNNPLFAGFSAPISDPYMPRPYNVGNEVRNVPISDPYMPQPFTGLNQPVGMNNVAPVLAQNTANYQMYGEQLPLGGNPMFNPMYNAPDVNNPLFAGYSAPMPNNMNQQGFVPMGGSNPQNTSYGSFGAIQQPMGGYGNIGSLLGKG
jgi:hypothetical protein